MASRREKRQQMLKGEGAVNEESTFDQSVETEETNTDENTVEAKDSTIAKDEVSKTKNSQDSTVSQAQNKKQDAQSNTDAQPQTTKVATFGDKQMPVNLAVDTEDADTRGQLQRQWLEFLSFLGDNEARRIMGGKNWMYTLRTAIGKVNF